MRKNWFLGFLGFIGLRGIDALVRQDWPETAWLLWFAWLFYFWPMPKKNGRKVKHQNLSILLAVLVILIGLVVYMAPRVSQQADSSSASAWQEFGMPAYDGLHFWYPPTLNLATRDFGNGERGHMQVVLTEKTAVYPQDGEGPPAISIDIFQNMEGNTTGQWVQGMSYSNFKLSDGDLSPVEIGDETGLTYSWSGLYEGRSVVVARKDYVFMLSVTYLTPNDTLIQNFEDILKTVEFH